MLTPGNKKLGQRLIWGFGLASGTPEICVGLSSVCQLHCYAIRMERLRPAVSARYAKNLLLSRQRDFEHRVRYFILDHEIAVVRIHTGGDFYSSAYTRKWLRIIQRLPQVAFFCYSRSWRDPAIRTVLETISALPNARLWYSCDRETGVPKDLASRIRLAWLMTEPDEIPPTKLDLLFRIRRLRSRPQTRMNGTRVCPEEDGVARKRPVTCDLCKLCWRPLPPVQQGLHRIALPLVKVDAGPASSQET